MRSAVLDLGSQPIRNLAVNPRGVLPSTGYGVQTLTQVTGLVGAPDGAVTAVRVSHVNAGANPGVNLTPANLKVGVSYYMQADIFVESLVTGSDTTLAFAATGQSSMTPRISTPVGVWVRMIWQSPAVTSTPNGRSLGVRRDSGQTGSFLVTNQMVIEGKGSPLPYADGDFPGWRWTGTPNASESVGYPLLAIH